MVEICFTRAKNSVNIIMNNLMDFSLGTIIFFVIGFGLMFGGGNSVVSNFIGTPDLFTQNDYSFTYPNFAFLIFQTVFWATTTMFVTWIKYKNPDVSMTLNGVLAGLVGAFSVHRAVGL